MQTPSIEWKEIGNFLRSRREKALPLSPVSAHGRSRQRPHLTQTELAQLANVSTVLISKLEQGQYENINSGILKRIAAALKLTDDDEQFVTGLLVPSPNAIDMNESVPEWITEGIAEFSHPTIIVNPCFDILAWNSAFLGFMGDISNLEPEDRNVTVGLFCNPEMRHLFTEWTENVGIMVSSLKMIYSLIPPYRARIRALASRVASQDETFATLWKEAPPKLTTKVKKHVLHPVHGDMVINELVTQIVGTPFLFRVEFIPASESTRQKMELL